MVDWFGLLQTDLPPMTATYLETLNREQRRAVEHGVQKKNAAPGAALLVIAGAGSGKTNTVAHRVAHLIVNGADPRRILLMTFSRRAAAEMTRRVERIARQVMDRSAGVMTEALTWAGTFHGIGARLLREYADQIGVDPSFTIHDREDSADLMNLVRHELGFSRTESLYPSKRHWLVGIVDWPDRAGLPGVARESPCFEHLERTCTPAGRPRRKSCGRLRFERQYRD